MSMTRAMDLHRYKPGSYDLHVQDGYVRSATVNNVVTTWAISRPTATPAPLYSPPAAVPRGTGFGGFTPAQPNTMMDPSDPSTWQRQYRFT